MQRISLLVLAVLDATYAASPYVMNWSSQAYGPDGPWQAVTVEVGSNKQPVALYPGATYTTTILTDSICTNKTVSATCYASQAGTYNQTESTSAHLLSKTSWETLYWAVEGKGIEEDLGDQISFGPTVPNVSIQAIDQTYQTYPNGKAYPVQVGNLALGAPWSTATVDNVTLNMITPWLYNSGGDNAIPSYSYGMHIGSVSPAIPASLVLGGYDQSRVLGNVSAQSVTSTSGTFQISLKDIGLGLIGNNTPAGFTSQGGLFQHGEGESTAEVVTIDPTKPYMYLPEATCNAITASLPVSFNQSLGLYFWDTTSSNYANLTSSPTYLSFTFSLNNATSQNFTIKVPLAQLALTLQEPLVEQNQTYFPCFLSTDTPVLGRAFLQSAFVGVNYHEGANSGTWFLAQAPGPSVSNAVITTITVPTKSIAGTNASWEASWAEYFHLDTTTTSQNSTTVASGSGGLSAGAKAGIGVGVGVGGALVIAAAVLWMVRRKRRQRRNAGEKRKPGEGGFVELPARVTEGPPRELDTKKQVQARELAGAEPPRYELE
ncbi:putative aspartic-type endopeptidase [Aspergillus brunneoviolaceus CBS 621.78]|uniref:Aspartic-type endopeptidase n=1 Tax=Aspergillus brunneoviolaceus CBS 621.78 TaxID=1450534 RepID=A0ACD1GEB1_9EURO|nr:putative aspartic-type endopeptidase [Aspergillus brunneoviolaceus CBS 621.78]RAH47515.1 putative aspartic-type endopeptidase [Aspergillus brunneoviolaceus CBS 621.78]